MNVTRPDGALQTERLPAGLGHEYFLPFEHKLADLLVFVSKLAAQLSFPLPPGSKSESTNPAERETWEVLFADNDVLAAARIMGLDLDDWNARFEVSVNGREVGQQVDLEAGTEVVSGDTQALLIVCELVSAIKGWQQAADQISAKHAALLAQGVLQFEGVCQYWKATPDELHRAISVMLDRGFSADEQENRRNLAKLNVQAAAQANDLSEAFKKIVAALFELKSSAGGFLQHSLNNGRQDPALGLLYAFLRLYLRITDHANLFTDKYTDFYYQILLGAQHQPGQSDRTYTSFETSSDIAQVNIPSGTQLIGGKDKNGQEVGYQTKMSFAANSAWISSLATLYVERDPLISPERDMGFATRLHSQYIELPEQRISDVEMLPVFGAYTPNDNHQHRAEGEIGFAFCSRTLAAAQGHRKYVLEIQCETEFESNAGVANALDILNKSFQSQAKFGTAAPQNVLDVLRDESFEKAGRNKHAQKDAQKDAQKENEKEEEKEKEIRLCKRRILRHFLIDQLDPRGVPSYKLINDEVERRMDDVDDPLMHELENCHASVSLLYRNLMLAMVCSADTPGEFRVRLGQYLTLYFLGKNDWLDDEIKSNLFAWSQNVIPEWPQDSFADPELELSDDRDRSGGHVFEGQILRLLLDETLTSDEEYVLHFYHLFRRMFELQLSVATGWLEITNWRLKPQRGSKQIGMVIEFELSNDLPAVVDYDSALHGEGVFDESPVCKILVNQHSSFFALSVVSNLVLNKIDVNVAVSDITNVLLQNGEGPLDPSSPFPFFGVMPAVNSALIVGCEEAVSKQICEFDLTVEWQGLPDDINGFGAYFAQYPESVANADFKVRIENLQGGHWVPIDDNPERLLFSAETTLPTSSKFCFSVDGDGYASTEYQTKTYEVGPASRGGFFRLVLTGPGQAFGAKSFGKAFAQVTTRNVKKRFGRAEPVPSEPFILTASRLSLSYKARAVIDIRQSGVIESDQANFFHIHPFGAFKVDVEQSNHQQSLVPKIDYDGNLLIGLKVKHANSTLDRVDIYFELDDKLVRNASGPLGSIFWSYLNADGWTQLSPQQLLLDSTVAFHRSGIVSILIPGDAVDNNAQMPLGQYWLKASAKYNLDKYGKIRKVATQCVEVERDGNQEPLAAEGIRWRLAAKIPGVLDVAQLGVYYGGEPAETTTQFRTRISERLRHKNRALTPWDYERLILQHFPDVYKAKCIRSMEKGASAAHPGRVLIVVVSRDEQPEFLSDGIFPSISAVRLRQIEEYLQGLSPHGAKVKVVNPQVETLQVRCAVQFTESYRRGEFRARLDHEISRYLWPWSAVGNHVAFDWVVRTNDVKNYIRALPFVDYVTDFSILCLSETGEQTYVLTDTAPNNKPVIRAAYHGSIGVPMSEHYIRIIDNNKFIPAQSTGVDELQINQTFVVANKMRKEQPNALNAERAGRTNNHA